MSRRACRCADARGSGWPGPCAGPCWCHRRRTSAGRWTSSTICLATGQRLRTLNIVDDFSRECPAIEVDTSLPGARVVRVLDRLAETRGLPEEIILDNGPEMIGKALDQWAWRYGVRLHFIDLASGCRPSSSTSSAGA